MDEASQISQNYNHKMKLNIYSDDSIKPDTFVPVKYLRINEFSRLLNRPLVRERKSVPALFCQDEWDFRTIGARINESSLYNIASYLF